MADYAELMIQAAKNCDYLTLLELHLLKNAHLKLKRGRSLLFLAASSCNVDENDRLETIKLLLPFEKFQSVGNNRAKTVSDQILHALAKNGAFESFKYVVEQKWCPIDVLDDEDQTCFIAARDTLKKQEYEEMAAYILERLKNDSGTIYGETPQEAFGERYKSIEEFQDLPPY